MTRTLVSLRRIAALSVASTLFATPIASAQTPAPASTSDTPASTTLLSPAAFARLIQPSPTGVATTPVPADSLRPSLVHQATALMAGENQPAPGKAPQQKSWASRHKVLIGVLIGAGAFFGGYGLWVASGCGGDCG